MKIVVIGAGAVGTLYGGWLLAGGADVSFVARGAQLNALRNHGLYLHGDRGNVHISQIRVSDAATDLPRADVAVLAVKLYDLEQAGAIATQCLVPGGLVVGLQNGVSAFATLSREFAPEQVMVGPVYSAAKLKAPGVIEYSGARHRVIIGNASNSQHSSAGDLIEAWRKAGVEAEISEDILSVLWMKFLGFATNAALTCLSRQPAGVVYRDPDLLKLARRAIGEIVEVGRAEGVTFGDDSVDATIGLLQSFPFEMVASMRQDLDAGRRLELDGITGEIVRLGRKHGISTIVHETAFACLKPYREGQK